MSEDYQHFLVPLPDGPAILCDEVWIMESYEEVMRLISLLAVDFGSILDRSVGEDLTPEPVLLYDVVYLVIIWTDRVELEIMEIVNATIEQYHGIRCVDEGRKSAVREIAYQQFINEISEIRREGALN